MTSLYVNVGNNTTLLIPSIGEPMLIDTPEFVEGVENTWNITEYLQNWCEENQVETYDGTITGIESRY